MKYTVCTDIYINDVWNFPMLPTRQRWERVFNGTGQYTELSIYKTSYHWGLKSSGIWGCDDGQVVSDVSKEHSDFNVKGPDVPEKPLTQWHSFMPESSRALLWEPHNFYCCKVHPVTGHTGPEVEHTWSDNKVSELVTMCLPWQHWTKALVWFDDVDISPFHSCVVDLWQSLSGTYNCLCVFRCATARMSELELVQ
jgi:hypothetical protein